jgi:hypothetical protein
MNGIWICGGCRPRQRRRDSLTHLSPASVKPHDDKARACLQCCPPGERRHLRELRVERRQFQHQHQRHDVPVRNREVSVWSERLLGLGLSCYSGVCVDATSLTTSSSAASSGSGGASSSTASSASAAQASSSSASAGGARSSSTGSGPAIVCNDVSTTAGTLTARYDSTMIDAGNGKTYYLQTNWWHAFDAETEPYNGLSFSVSNPNGATVPATDGNPMGSHPCSFGSMAVTPRQEAISPSR